MKSLPRKIFIGIDPGSRVLGFSVLSLCDDSIELLSSGVVVFEKKHSLADRLLQYFNFIVPLIKKYKKLGDVILALESGFFSCNIGSSFVLHSFYSLSLFVSSYVAISFCSLPPTQIKKMIAGYGAASKGEVLESILIFFPLYSFHNYYDEADAIAIALASYLNYMSLPFS